MGTISLQNFFNVTNNYATNQLNGVKQDEGYLKMGDSSQTKVGEKTLQERTITFVKEAPTDKDNVAIRESLYRSAQEIGGKNKAFLQEVEKQLGIEKGKISDKPLKPLAAHNVILLSRAQAPNIVKSLDLVKVTYAPGTKESIQDVMKKYVGHPDVQKFLNSCKKNAQGRMVYNLDAFCKCARLAADDLEAQLAGKPEFIKKQMKREINFLIGLSGHKYPSAGLDDKFKNPPQFQVNEEEIQQELELGEDAGNRLGEDDDVDFENEDIIGDKSDFKADETKEDAQKKGIEDGEKIGQDSNNLDENIKDVHDTDNLQQNEEVTGAKKREGTEEIAKKGNDVHVETPLTREKAKALCDDIFARMDKMLSHIEQHLKDYPKVNKEWVKSKRENPLTIGKFTVKEYLELSDLTAADFQKQVQMFQEAYEKLCADAGFKAEEGKEDVLKKDIEDGKKIDNKLQQNEEATGAKKNEGTKEIEKKGNDAHVETPLTREKAKALCDDIFARMGKMLSYIEQNLKDYPKVDKAWVESKRKDDLKMGRFIAQNYLDLSARTTADFQKEVQLFQDVYEKLCAEAGFKDPKSVAADLGFELLDMYAFNEGRVENAIVRTTDVMGKAQTILEKRGHSLIFTDISNYKKDFEAFIAKMKDVKQKGAEGTLKEYGEAVAKFEKFCAGLVKKYGAFAKEAEAAAKPRSISQNMKEINFMGGQPKILEEKKNPTTNPFKSIQKDFTAIRNKFFDTMQVPKDLEEGTEMDQERDGLLEKDLPPEHGAFPKGLPNYKAYKTSHTAFDTMCKEQYTVDKKANGEKASSQQSTQKCFDLLTQAGVHPMHFEKFMALMDAYPEGFKPGNVESKTGLNLLDENTGAPTSFKSFLAMPNLEEDQHDEAVRLDKQRLRELNDFALEHGLYDEVDKSLTEKMNAENPRPFNVNGKFNVQEFAKTYGFDMKAKGDQEVLGSGLLPGQDATLAKLGFKASNNSGLGMNCFFYSALNQLGIPVTYNNAMTLRNLLYAHGCKMLHVTQSGKFDANSTQMSYGENETIYNPVTHSLTTADNDNSNSKSNSIHQVKVMTSKHGMQELNDTFDQLSGKTFNYGQHPNLPVYQYVSDEAIQNAGILADMGFGAILADLIGRPVRIIQFEPTDGKDGDNQIIPGNEKESIRGDITFDCDLKTGAILKGDSINIVFLRTGSSGHYQALVPNK